jgi:phage tail sheath protein FI
VRGVCGFILGKAYTSVRLQAGRVQLDADMSEADVSLWKYVPVRRMLLSLERSLGQSLQWVVFEPNGEELWDRVRRLVTDFLLDRWQHGKLRGSKPEEAFFVRCDRSTMTQNDLDNGRLIVLVGVAAIRPAEFVIIRISAH